MKKPKISISGAQRAIAGPSKNKKNGGAYSGVRRTQKVLGK